MWETILVSSRLADRGALDDYTILAVLTSTKPAKHRRTAHEHVRFVHQARRFPSFPMFWRLGLLDVRRTLLSESLRSSALLFGKAVWATTVFAYPVSGRA